MTFKDVFKKSFLQGFATIELGTKEILVVLVLTTIIALYIYCVYRLMMRRTFYSKNFNISLVAVAIVTAAIILTIQSSVVVSLGMVGALSIVRFRTAVKDPIDLVFLFWSISVGIICGAGLVEIAVLASLFITIVLFILDRIPDGRAPLLLVVHCESSGEVLRSVKSSVETLCRHSKEKTKTITGNQADVIIELRAKDDEASKLVEEVSALKGVETVSLVRHDGEVTM